MTNSPRPRVVIVDGYSTGRELLRELLLRNVECLHLQSTAELPAAVATSFDRRPYDGDLGYLGDIAQAVDVLSTIAPDAVVAGSEWGVTYAEQVAHAMGLPTNRTETTAARRDKFHMIEAAKRHGLHVATQASVRTVEAAQAWADSHATWPVVVKPMTSAGSDGVAICQNRSDIEKAFAAAFGRRNFMGSTNDSLLIQSYLPGPQFIVNTVSRNGRHYVTDVWSMFLSISGTDVVPGGMQLLDPETPEAKALIDYTLEALSALGIENGAAHSELKWTPGGPALIEVGARLMGAAMDAPSYAAAGMRTQADVFAEVLAGSDAVACPRQYRFCQHMTKLLFTFKSDAEVVDVSGLALLSELPSFHGHYRALSPGARVWKTADSLARGGVVYLVHSDAQQIAADIATFRSREARGALYGLRERSVA